jgi:hypothetical protein
MGGKFLDWTGLAYTAHNEGDRRPLAHSHNYRLHACVIGMYRRHQMATKVVVAMYLQSIHIRHLNGETFLQRPHPAGRQD